jgi:hypothetical protein
MRIAHKRRTDTSDDAKWDSDLAQLGETLLFTPEALKLMTHSRAADLPSSAVLPDSSIG